MGPTLTWKETADVSLAQLAIALQPHHHASLDKGECFAMACLLRQQVEKLPGMIVETAILSDLIERMEQKLSVQMVSALPVRRPSLSAVPA